MMTESWSATKLIKRHETGSFERASSVDNMLVPTTVYEGSVDRKPYHVNAEAMPMQAFHVPTHATHKEEELV